MLVTQFRSNVYGMIGRFNFKLRTKRPDPTLANLIKFTLEF